MFQRIFVKLMVIQLTNNKLTHYLPSGVIPEGMKIISIKTRKTGKTNGERVLESGAGYDGIILALKRIGTDVDFEIPLASIYSRSVLGDCNGYVFKVPVSFNFGESGSELRSNDSANVTTGNVVELEIECGI